MKRKKFFVILFIAAAIGLFVFAGSVLREKEDSYQPQQNIQAPIEVPGEFILTIQEAEKTDKPIAAMFYVDWCSYCRKYMPVFVEFAKAYKDKYSFAAINCDRPENVDMVNKFHIMGFPSLFIIDNKINHKFSLNLAATTDESVMREELDNYLNVRKNFVK